MKDCKRNPQLPPHSHYRVNGVLVCEGYSYIPKEAAPKETKGYVAE